MADFRNMLGSDEDSNEDIDHIPKTPGPPIISSDRESDDQDKSGDEKEEEEEVVKDNAHESDSDSDSSSSQSDSSNDNIRNSRNDSEVERSDNENEDHEPNEEIDHNRETAKTSDAIEANEEPDMSSDNEDKNVKESHHNDEDVEEEQDSDNEDIVRRTSPKKKRQLEEEDDSDNEDIVRKTSPKKRQLADDSDSSEGERSDRNKKQRTESNDNEDNEESDKNEGNEDRDEEMADKSAKAKDIFGELSSEDEDEEEDKQKDKQNDDIEKDSDKESVSYNRDNERRDEESGDEVGANREVDGEQSFIEDELQEEPIPETRIEVEIPRIVADLGHEVHFVKLPNFLSIDTHPYDPQWYEDEIDEDENLDDEGRARLKLKVENTIRWRNVVDRETNELKKESNTRVVKWSDGSFSLHLGEEIFDIHKLQLMTGDNNHLFIRQGTGLQGQTVFRTKLNFRPFSTESFTHRKLTLSLADRSQKTQKIRVLPNVGKDPEAHRTEMIKKEEDRLKASIRRENKQRRVRERSLIRGPTASYLEPDGDEDEEEGGISLSRIKNQYKRGSFNKLPYEDQEASDSGEESKPANDEDDSEDDLFDKKTEKKKSVHIVESDDE